MLGETLFNFMFTGLMSFGNPPFNTLIFKRLVIQDAF